MLKQTQPNAILMRVDGDDQVLVITQAKCAQAAVEISFTQGMAFELPYPDQTLDRFVSSLVFHQLTRPNEQRALIIRVLRTGGELHIVDFGKPQTPLAGVVGLFLRQSEQVADNIDGLLPVMMRAAGFDKVAESTHYTSVFSTLTLFYARKPGTPDEPV